MPDLKLKDNEKNQLKEMYLGYTPSNSNDIDHTLTDWKKWSEKILQESLKLNEYTNIAANATYLCNFLERKTIAFGLSKPGTSHQYMVHMNAKNQTAETYYVKQDTKESAGVADATNVFDEKIKPLFKKVAEVRDISALSELEKSNEYKWYEAKQILRKIVVLQNAKNLKLPLIHIYQDKTIDALYDYFFGDDKSTDLTFFEKNNAIARAAEGLFWSQDETKEPLKNIQKLSSFLWELFNFINLATDESPNVIYYGAPGTGKTYIVTKMVKFVTRNQEDHYKFIQFHPVFSYEDFMDGLKPIGIKNDAMAFDFVNGVFKQFCIDAKKKPEETFYFIVDEINRANLSAVFGETLSLLEAGYRDKQKDEKGQEQRHLIHTQNCNILASLIKGAENNPALKKKYIDLAYEYDDKTGQVMFGIPANIRFIGMMNDVDKSIDTFDLALRRRFRWEHMGCDYEIIEDFYRGKDVNSSNEIEKYVQYCKDLNEYITSNKNGGLGLGSSYEFGHSFFMKLPNMKINKKNRIKLFENYLAPTLREYLRGFFEEGEIGSKLEKAKDKFGIKNTDKKESSDSNEN